MATSFEDPDGQLELDILEVPRTPEDLHPPLPTISNPNTSSHAHSQPSDDENDEKEREQRQLFPKASPPTDQGRSPKQRRLSIQVPTCIERAPNVCDQVPIDYFNPEGVSTLRRSLSNAPRTGSSSMTTDQSESADSEATLNDVLRQPLDFENFLRFYLRKCVYLIYFLIRSH